MKFIIYSFTLLFTAVNLVAAFIYIGYYLLFIPQLNAAIFGWLVVIFSLIEIPLLLRVTHHIGTKHSKWLLIYVVVKVFCMLLIVKCSFAVHPSGQPVTVSEALSALFIIFHTSSLIIISTLKRYTPRISLRGCAASISYLLAICIGLTSIGLIGADIYTRIQTEYYATNIEKNIQKKSFPIASDTWKSYDHFRKPDDVLPGFHMRVPPSWQIDDKMITISTSSAQLTIDRSGTSGKLCLYPDIFRSDVLYNNHIYISLIPVWSFELNKHAMRLGLMPVKKHSSTFDFIVCEKWVRFDGLTEYMTDIYNQDMGNISITVKRNDVAALKQVLAILQTITLLP